MSRNPERYRHSAFLFQSLCFHPSTRQAVQICFVVQGPILAGTLGTVTKNTPLRNLGIRSEIIGLTLCLLCGECIIFIVLRSLLFVKLCGSK